MGKRLGYCQQYVKGLFHACRSNIERMEERLPDTSYDGLHHFISEACWDGQGVMGQVAREVQASLSALSGEQGLLLDECGWAKAGSQSVGVGRQYIGALGKTENGQVGVFAGLVRGAHAGLVGAHLYLPQAWCSDAARCQQARIPAADRAYRSKPELATQLVGELLGSGAVTADWVGGDALYGGSPGLRQALQALGQAYVLDIQPTLHVYATDPTPAAGPTWSGRGRRPKRWQPVGVAAALQAVVAAAAGTDPWTVHVHRPGTKGPLRRRALLVDVWLWSAEHQTAQPLQVLASSELDGSEIKYSLCYSPPNAPALSVRTALQRQMQRYWIERLFQEAKQQLGFHQYQTRSWTAWYHHMALSLMAMHFMLKTQLEGDETMPYLSFASIKLLLAQKLRNKLDHDDALMRAISKRSSYLKSTQPQKSGAT
ncbi:MAG: IS701 family transposase [Hymenobacteraceae bacterium]|nr:IS701 family transposase [Hymenobacteraceae bacterium]